MGGGYLALRSRYALPRVAISLAFNTPRNERRRGRLPPPKAHRVANISDGNDAQRVVHFFAKFLFDDVLDGTAGAGTGRACAGEFDVDEVFLDIDDFDVAVVVGEHGSDVFVDDGLDLLGELEGGDFGFFGRFGEGFLDAPTFVEEVLDAAGGMLASTARAAGFECADDVVDADFTDKK